MRVRFLISVLIGFGSFLAGLHASHAAMVTWNGSESTFWEEDANWTGGKPTDADTAVFPTSIPGTGATIALADNSQTYQLSFNNSYVLTGGKLNFPLIPEGSAASPVLTVGAGSTVTLETQLVRATAGGSSGMTKGGAGTLILAVDNTLLNGTWFDVQGYGVLDLRHDNALGAIEYANVAPGSSLHVQNNITVSNGVYIRGDGVGGAGGALRSVSGANIWAGYVRPHRLAPDASIGGDATSRLHITGRVEHNTNVGVLSKVGEGMLILSGDNTHRGLTRVKVGVLNIRHNNALGTTHAGTQVDSGAALQVQNNITVPEAIVLNGSGIAETGVLRSVSGNNFWNGTIEHNAAWIGVDAGTMTINGQISGSGTLRKVGGGMLVLAGHNSYEGPTLLDAGVLGIRHDNALGTTGSGTSVRVNA